MNGTANMAAIIAIDNTLLETFRLEYENYKFFRLY